MATEAQKCLKHKHKTIFSFPLFYPYDDNSFFLIWGHTTL